jgi:PAS domain-containing protein/DNA-binding CsgD family transcriptional regulator
MINTRRPIWWLVARIEGRGRMDREARFEDVIGLLYDAAAEPQRWPAALSGIADLLGAVGSQFSFWDRRQNTTKFAVVGGLPEEGNAAYLRYYGTLDTRRQALERLPVGRLMVADEHFDDGRFRKSEFFNDFLVPYGVPYVVGGRPFEAAGLSAVIAVLRDFRQGPFGEPEIAELRRLVPHLQRAARLHAQMHELRLHNQTVEAALDRLPFGVVVADASGRALIINRAAEDMAATNDGLLLRSGRLTATRTGEAARLARHIAEAAQSAACRRGQGGGALLVSRPSGRRSFALLVAPLSPDVTLAAAHQAPAALILITDLNSAPAVLGNRLIELFGLTPAEACLAVGLSSGKRLIDVAEERSLRMPTLRAQLRAILAKTGSRRQADLMRLIVSLPADRRRP